MAKLKLTPDPTFKAKVPVPVPGKGAADVEFTFKWRTADEADKWFEETKDHKDVDLIPTMATGWELDEPFDAENIARLCSTYQGAAVAIVRTYIGELKGQRLKN